MTINNTPQQARQHMRQDIYAAIRRNLIALTGDLSRHEVVEILADILSGQISVIKEDASKQRIRPAGCWQVADPVKGGGEKVDYAQKLPGTHTSSHT